MGVDLTQLFKVQPGGRLVDTLDIEKCRRFGFGEDFLVAMAPAKAQQVGLDNFAPSGPWIRET